MSSAKVYAVATPALPDGVEASPMYEALVDAILAPNSSAEFINRASLELVKNSCKRWRAYLSALSRENSASFGIANDHLKEAAAAINEANEQDARINRAFGVLLTFAVVGFLGPAAGATAGWLASGGAAAAKTLNTEGFKDVAKDVVKNLLRASAGAITDAGKSAIASMLSVRGDPTQHLANCLAKADNMEVLMTEQTQRVINQTAWDKPAEKRAAAVAWAKSLLWEHWIFCAPATPESDVAAHPRNIGMRHYFTLMYLVKWALERDRSYWLRVGSEMTWPASTDVATRRRQEKDIAHASLFEPIGRLLGIVGVPKSAISTRVAVEFGGQTLFDVNKFIWWCDHDATRHMQNMVPAPDSVLSNWTSQLSSALRGTGK